MESTGLIQVILRLLPLIIILVINIQLQKHKRKVSTNRGKRVEVRKNSTAKRSFKEGYEALKNLEKKGSDWTKVFIEEVEKNKEIVNKKSVKRSFDASGSEVGSWNDQRVDFGLEPQVLVAQELEAVESLQNDIIDNTINNAGTAKIEERSFFDYKGELDLESNKSAGGLNNWLDGTDMRRAMVIKEILDRPVSLR